MPHLLWSDLLHLIVGGACGVLFVWLPARLRRDALLPFSRGHLFSSSRASSFRPELGDQILLRASRECMRHWSSVVPSVLFGTSFAAGVVAPRALARWEVVAESTWLIGAICATFAVAGAQGAFFLTSVLLRRHIRLENR